MRKIGKGLISIVTTLILFQEANAQMACREILREQPKNELTMGLENWNRIKFDDGSEMGLTILHFTVDHGFVVSSSLRGTFYFSHLVDGFKENVVTTPVVQKFEYSDLGIQGKYITILGEKTTDGSRLVIRVRVLGINLKSGKIEIGSVALENEISNGFLRGRTRQPIKSYSVNNIDSVFSSPIKQLGPIEVDSLTGSMSGRFALPE